MDIGKELRVIEVEEPSVSPKKEEIVVEVAVTEPADPYPRRI